MALPFSNTTTNLGIVQRFETHIGVGFTGVSGVATLLDQCVGYCNEAQNEAWADIFLSYGGWQFDDSNQTDMPSATGSLVASQVSYALPPGALTVRGVEVMNQGSTTWYPLSPITEEQIRQGTAVSEFNKNPAQPSFYRLVGETIYMYPPANYSQASSFRVYFDRSMVDFVDTDTTKTPGFAGAFHSYIPLSAALMYLEDNQSDQVNKIARLQTRLDVLKDKMKKFYASRFQQMFPPKISVNDPMREAM